MLALLVLAGALALRWLLKPEHLAPAILDLAGDALGLEITATGVGEYRLRGTPQLIVRGVSARAPGAATPVLTAERILIAVPWSTLRARGRDLTATRVELDAPILDIAALQAWQATRPPGETRLPTLTHGLRIHDGTVAGDGWRIESLETTLPTLAADRPLSARLRGRYRADAVQAPFDLALHLDKFAAESGIGVAGQLTLEGSDWRVPMRPRLSARMSLGDAWRLERTTLGMSAQLISGNDTHPFALGAAGSMALQAGELEWQPAALSVRGGGAIPTLDASGGAIVAEDLQLQLAGQLREWPAAWPALPPPLGQSGSPLPFALAYAGKPDASGIAQLRLQRDDMRFDGRFRLPQVMAWLDAFDDGTPLPPLTGHLTMPRLEISGATLEGVDVRIEDPGAPPPGPIR